MDQRLNLLYMQRSLNDKYQIMENTRRVPLYLDRIQAYNEPYVITQQLDRNTIHSLFQANAQKLAYPNIICGRPPIEGKSRYNYAIDNHITNKLVDISGQVFKNSDLRVQPNKYVTPAKLSRKY